MIHIYRVVQLWRENLAKVNEKAAASLADPTDYENLFPGLRESFKAEQYLQAERKETFTASQYTTLPVSGNGKHFNRNMCIQCIMQDVHVRYCLYTCIG